MRDLAAVTAAALEPQPGDRGGQGEGHLGRRGHATWAPGHLAADTGEVGGHGHTGILELSGNTKRWGGGEHTVLSGI